MCFIVDCVVLCVVCKCVLYYCHRVSTQLQLTNIYYYIIGWLAVSTGNVRLLNILLLLSCRV